MEQIVLVVQVLEMKFQYGIDTKGKLVKSSTVSYHISKINIC